jgi:transcriptional regulator with XRE-family HTH domain
MSREEFTDWLQKEIEQRGWTVAELARRAEVAHGTINNVMSGMRNPGLDLCCALAHALGVPEVEVLWRAGLLRERPATVDQPWLAEIIEAARQLTPEKREYAVTLLKMLKADTLTLQGWPSTDVEDK